MPALSAEIGIRTTALLQWVEGSTGIGWSKFLEVLKEVTDISVARTQVSRSERLAFSIAGTIDEVDEATLKAIAELLRKTSNDASLEIIRIQSGSIRLILKGSPEGLERLQELVNSRELNEILGRQVQSTQVFFDLCGADLQGADLRGANLKDADLGRASLISSQLRDTDFSNAILCSTNLDNTDLSNTNFSGANLSRANLGGANLQRANLSLAILYEANLSNANLSDAILINGDLRGTNLRTTILSHADLSLATLHNADLHNAILNDADLRFADFHFANLRGANLCGTDLSDAILSSANVERTIFGNNRGLTEADKRGLQQRGAIFQDPPSSDVISPIPVS